MNRSILLLIILINLNLTAQNAGSPMEIPRGAEIIIVGDLMAHMDQVRGSWIEEEQRYDFYPCFQHVEPYLSDGDITMGNLETTLAGPHGAFRHTPNTAFREYQGFPYFNTPDEYALALKQTGFDVLSLANNHTLDSNMTGARRTLQVVEDLGMVGVGTGPSDQDLVEYINVQGMEIAFLSYTFCTNEFTQIEEDGFKVNSLNFYQQPLIDQMLATVEEAAANSDFILVMIHYGWSYRYYPDDWQVKITDLLLQAGADFVAGDHPHVLQPMAFVENGQGQRAFRIYSLSNFISHQRYAGNPPVSRDGGVILKVHLSQRDGEEVEIQRVEYMPTWVRHRGDLFEVLSVDQALANQADYGFAAHEIDRLRHLEEESPSILGGSLPGHGAFRYFPAPPF